MLHKDFFVWKGEPCSRSEQCSSSHSMVKSSWLVPTSVPSILVVISQTSLESDPTLPMCFPFCKSGSASLLEKQARDMWCEWLETLQLLWAGDLPPAVRQRWQRSHYAHVGAQGCSTELQQEEELSSDSATGAPSLTAGMGLCQVPASPPFPPHYPCAAVQCQAAAGMGAQQASGRAASVTVTVLSTPHKGAEQQTVGLDGTSGASLPLSFLVYLLFCCLGVWGFVL